MEQYTNPRIWGPHFWFVLRCIVNNYPLSPTNEDKQHMEGFFKELQFTLPCEKCKYTFKQHCNKYPITKSLCDKHKLIEWLELMYEATNKSIANNRVKIIDDSSDGEMLPMKQIIKSEKDKTLEKHLNEAKKNVINSTTLGTLTTLPMFNNQITNPYIPQKLPFAPKTHNLNVDTPIFDKQRTGKKNTSRSNTKQLNNANFKPIPMARVEQQSIQILPIINQVTNSPPKETIKTVTMPPITKPLSKTDKLIMQQQLFIPLNNDHKIKPKEMQKDILSLPTKLTPPPKQKTVPSSIPDNKPIIPAKTLPTIPYTEPNRNQPKPKPAFNYTKPILPNTYNPLVNANTHFQNIQMKPKSRTAQANLTVISKCKKCTQ